LVKATFTFDYLLLTRTKNEELENEEHPFNTLLNPFKCFNAKQPTHFFQNPYFATKRSFLLASMT